MKTTSLLMAISVIALALPAHADRYGFGPNVQAYLKNYTPLTQGQRKDKIMGEIIFVFDGFETSTRANRPARKPWATREERLRGEKTRERSLTHAIHQMGKMDAATLEATIRELQERLVEFNQDEIFRRKNKSNE